MILNLATIYIPDDQFIFSFFFFLLSNGVLTTIISLLLALIKTIENNFKKYLQLCKEQPFSFIKYSG